MPSQGLFNFAAGESALSFATAVEDAFALFVESKSRLGWRPW